MNQEQIAAMFRQDELERRQARRFSLQQQLRTVLAKMANEGILLDEVLTPADKQAHATAVACIQRQREFYERQIRQGYWRRLWLALLNK